VRQLLVIVLVWAPLFSQSLSSRLVAPVFYEIGVSPSFQSNPLNLSSVELKKAATDAEYLGGITNSSSKVITLSANIIYAPRLFAGRKTQLNSTMNSHFYLDIRQRNYQTYSVDITQSLGKYRFFNIGYWFLPEYYLRNYLFKNPGTQISSREVCNFGSNRVWLGLEHRLSRKNRVEYQLNVRNEIYQAPFSHFDLHMLEGGLIFRIGQFDALSITANLQYGVAENDNRIDDLDRSYEYFNIHPTFTFSLPGKHKLRLATRYDQRAYHSEQADDPLHSGRFQEEFRVDATFLPNLSGKLIVEPFVGYRKRQVDSIDPAVRDLKSFSRYWFGISFGFKSVIDMYF